MRVGDAVRLCVADIDLDRGTLMIQRSKGARASSPSAPISSPSFAATPPSEGLVRERRRADLERFFLRLDASPLTVASVSNAIRQRLRQLGIKPPDGRIGARPYEFRHNSGCRIIPSDAIVPQP
ncbi:hypothetical protein [Mesorhizobium sp. M0643]|uniref:hypothetical protein n=1 Tax=Mesorhizobium sp. M0643 TaxID=2956978 RepID=UPI00333B6239